MTANAEIVALLQAAGRVLGLRVFFRDFLGIAGLDRHLTWHLDPACLAVKTDPARLRGCVAFCAGSVIRELATLPEGRMHTCPFGHTEIAVPVLVRGQYLGVLGAGPMWIGERQPPREGLVAVRDRAWIDDRLLALRGLALQIAGALDRHLTGQRHDRRWRILSFLERRISGDVGLADLARHLELSPSRCGHLVKELFSTTFPALLRGVRLNQAMRRLHETDEPVAVLARRLGFPDAGYFSRVFRKAHGCTPLEFRHRRRDAV